MNWLKSKLKKSELIVSWVRSFRRMKFKIERNRKIQTYLSQNQIKKLQIGAGNNILSGWLNSDLYPLKEGVIFLDSTKKFPFEDATFNYIFSEHQIEHISYKDAVFMLKECFRVLSPSGKIRVLTPDLEFYVSLGALNRSPIQVEYITWVTDAYIRTGFCMAEEYIPIQNVYRSSFVINDIFRNYEHKFIYDRETLQELMAAVGFVNITSYQAGHSSNSHLTGIDSSANGIASFGTLVLEGSRP